MIKRNDMRYGYTKRTAYKSRNRKLLVRGRRIPRKTNKDLIIYRSPVLRQQPFPPRYRCTFTTAIYGAVAAGSASGQYFAFLNSSYLPFNGGGWPAALPAIATLQPTGYTAMANANLYRNIRVYGSRIVIEFLPQALTDTVEVTVTPSVGPGSPTSTATAMAQPNTRSMFMSSSKMNSKNGSAIRNSITQHKFLGVSSSAIQNDLSGNYTHAYNANPVIDNYWVVNWATPDNVNLATPLEYRVKLTHYVELYNQVAANLVQT